MTTLIQATFDGWLVLSSAGHPGIRLHCAMLDRIVASDRDLLLSIGTYTVALTTDASSLARELASRLSAYTRRRSSSGARSLGDVLFLGDRAVRVAGDYIHIGSEVAYSIADVRHYAERGAVLPVPSGVLQAALAMLVVEFAHTAQVTDEA